MKGLKWLLIGGAAYLGYQLLVKAGAAAGLSVSVKRIKYGGTDLSKSWFDVELGIVNPSSESFAFTRFFGQLRFNGALLATLTKDGAGAGIRILPAAETVITVPVYINHLSTLLSAKEIIEKIIAKVPVTGLSFNGMLYAGSYSIPIEQSVDLSFGSGISGTSTNCFTCDRPAMGGVLN